MPNPNPDPNPNPNPSPNPNPNQVREVILDGAACTVHPAFRLYAFSDAPAPAAVPPEVFRSYHPLAGGRPARGVP